MKNSELHMLARALNDDGTTDCAFVAFHDREVSLEIYRRDKPAMALCLSQMPQAYIDLALDISIDQWGIIFTLFEGLERFVVSEIMAKDLADTLSFLDGSEVPN
jgi:hypothetical protein